MDSIKVTRFVYLQAYFKASDHLFWITFHSFLLAFSNLLLYLTLERSGVLVNLEQVFTLKVAHHPHLG